MVQEIIAFSYWLLPLVSSFESFSGKRSPKKTVETGIVGVVKSLHLYVICSKQFLVSYSNDLKGSLISKILIKVSLNDVIYHS